MTILPRIALPVLLLVASSSLALRDPKDRPNIIMLFVDDLGVGDLGYTGHPTTYTPNLDRLARNGMTLTTWYSGAPLCSASRASIMTGRQAAHVGVPPVFGPTVDVGMVTNVSTAATVAKAAGYATAACGKWHLGQAPEFMPGSRGFDSYLGIPYSDDMGEARATPCASGEPTRRILGPANYVDSLSELGYSDSIAEFEKVSGDPAASYLPLVYQQGDGQNASLDVLEQPLDFTTLALKYENFTTEFIKRNKDHPFFLYVPFSHVHTTADNQPDMQYAGCAWQNFTSRGPFGDALAEVDWHVGKIVETLESLGLEKNTLILQTGDNGPWLVHGLSAGSQGLFDARSSGYLNTGKGCTWEGGVRESGLAYWPGVIEAGSRSQELVSSLDLLPTLANLTKQPTPEGLAGRNMLPVLLGGNSEHEFFWMYNERCQEQAKGVCAVRYGDYKAHFVTQPGIGASSGPTVTYGTDPPLIFNVAMDPSEQYPLTEKGKMPTDPELLSLISDIKAAYTEELKKPAVASQKAKEAGPWGICCDRTKNCDCDGKPSDAQQWVF